MIKSNLAVAYFRANDATSIEHQRHEALAYCNRKGLTLVGEYVDVAYSARNDKRPAFLDLMLDAQLNTVWRTVLVSDLSRFSRNIYDTFKYRKLLTDNNITLTCINQDLGSSHETLPSNIAELISKISAEYATSVNPN